MGLTVIGNQKGGCGKTTVASNLAAYKEATEEKPDILLVDCDPQETLFKWSMRREELNLDHQAITCIRYVVGNTEADIAKFVRDMLKNDEKFSDVIIDMAGKDSSELRGILYIADILLIPIQPKAFDMETAKTMDDMVNNVSVKNPFLKAWFVINRASPNPMVKPDLEMHRNSLKGYEFVKTSDAILYDRKPYSDMAMLGQSVLAGRKTKASAEIMNLGNEVFSEQ